MNPTDVAQANLPLLTTRDKRAIMELTKEFDIDFVALTYTCSAEDVIELRQFLHSLGRDSIRVIAKVALPHIFTPHRRICRGANKLGFMDERQFAMKFGTQSCITILGLTYCHRSCNSSFCIAVNKS